MVILGMDTGNAGNLTTGSTKICSGVVAACALTLSRWIWPRYWIFCGTLPWIFATSHPSKMRTSEVSLSKMVVSWHIIGIVPFGRVVHWKYGFYPWFLILRGARCARPSKVLKMMAVMAACGYSRWPWSTYMVQWFIFPRGWSWFHELLV